MRASATPTVPVSCGIIISEIAMDLPLPGARNLLSQIGGGGGGA